MRSVIFLSMILFVSCSQKDEPYFFLKVEIQEQIKKEREFLYPYSEQVFKQSDFLFPVLLETSDKGIFVLDVADDSRVRRYNWDFDLIDRIGRGTGDGPGEIGGVNDIHVNEDTLYFTDASNALLHLYTIDNEFVRSISIDGEIASQVTTLGDVIVLRINRSEQALFIDTTGNPILRTDEISIDDIRYRTVLESRLFANGGHLYRIPSFFGLLLKYDREGALILTKELVDASEAHFEDDTPDPQEQPIMIRRDDANRVSVSASFYQDKICILRFYRFEGERFIDCYDTSDLTYLFSFIPPENTVDFEIYQDYFIAIHDTSLTVWEWDEN